MQLFDHVGAAVQNDFDRFAHLLNRIVKSHRCTQAVEVGKAMAHNQHVLAGIEQLAQGCRHDTGLNFGALLDALGHAAIEFVAVFILDSCLVAAASQRHIQRLSGELFSLQKALSVASDTDGEGGRHLVVCVDLAHGIEDGKAFLDDGAHVSLLKRHKVTVLFQLFDDAVVVFDVTFDLILDLAHDLGALVFARALQQLLIVVDEDDGDHRTGGEILLGDAL